MKNFTFILMTLLAISLFASGCDEAGNKDKKNDAQKQADDGHDHSHDRHVAKHGGHVIELGRNHEYHAEIVHNEGAKSIDIYLMDGSEKSMTINGVSASIVATSGGETQTFAMQSSEDNERLTSSDPALLKLIDAKDLDAKLRFTINGKPFSGSFSHNEHVHDDHSGHNHD